jgi:golgi-specific brefeldin A-resistance guanine nucleotide exchange factor 1
MFPELLRLIGLQEEAIAESLKNVLLVMSSQGVIVPPSAGGGRVWDVTWQKLGRVLPKLKGEVFPDEGGEGRVIDREHEEI